MSSQCPHCGEHLGGDGHTSVMHCPYTEEDTSCLEPDANPVHCNFEGEVEMTEDTKNSQE